MQTVTKNTVKASDITAKGCTVGFDSKGNQICASKKKTKGILVIKVYLHQEGDYLLSRESLRNFGDMTTALQHINNMLDAVKTSELAWW